MKETWEDTAERGPGAIFWRGFKWFIGFIVLITVLGYGINWLFFPAKVATDLRDQTFDANRMVYVYENFFNQYEAVKATARKIQNQQDALDNFMRTHPNPDSWKYNERQEQERLNSSLMAVRNILADQVTQYNADAAKINREFLKSDKLPDHLEIDDFDKKQ